MESPAQFVESSRMHLYKKILITGASGFIGRHLLMFLSQQSHQLIACISENDSLPSLPHLKTVSLRLPDPTFDKIIATEKPDFILHCAGSASVAESFKQPEKDFEKSVIITQSILNAIKEYSPATKLLFLSSAAVYGNPTRLPIDSNTPLNPISPYGYHKLLCEINCEKFHRLFNIPITIVRIFSVYGPGLKKQILWDIYQKAKKSKTISLYGTGKETRDFIYIDDLISTLYTILNHSDFNANIINIATGQSTSIENLAKQFVGIVDDTISIQFNGETKSGDPAFWNVCPSLLTYTSASYISTETGIKRYIDWICKESETI
jgi:UDP-glucose 4-epimerase